MLADLLNLGGGGGSRLGAFIKMQSPGVQGYVDSYFGLWVRWRAALSCVRVFIRVCSGVGFEGHGFLG